MTIPARDASRTARLLELMKKGDDAFTRSSSGAGDWITVVTNATGTFTRELALPDPAEATWSTAG